MFNSGSSADQRAIYFSILNDDNTVFSSDTLVSGTESTTLDYRYPFVASSSSGGFCIVAKERILELNVQLFCFDSNFDPICNTKDISSAANTHLSTIKIYENKAYIVNI